ncbi:MAG: class I SAM-dependent methyltransferase [Dialister sp.]|nr:class I SAM-dependent methyltransferase [Dialister sp.]
MRLGARLRAVADKVPAAEVIADIGTDHGYIPIYLMQKGRIQRAIATDIHEGPAGRAALHAETAGLAEKIDIRVGNGLSVLSAGEAAGAVMAGMGGFMIRDILRDGNDVAARMRWFVLQPNTHVSDLRVWLSRNGYAVEEEILCEENGKLYVILFVVHGKMDTPKGLMADIGRLPEFADVKLFQAYLDQLISYRRQIAEGICEHTQNENNRVKRKQALAEIAELEDWKWKLTHK